MWVEFIFHGSSTPKRHEGVTRLYTKAGFRCVELEEHDEHGCPIIVAYPLGNIFSECRPHLHHLGAAPRRGAPRKES